LKSKRNSSVFVHTLISNLCVVRVHAFFAREISMLQSENLSFWFSTSSVQSVQAYVENSQEAPRPKALPSTPRSAARSLYRWTNTENSRSTLWPYSTRIELALSCHTSTGHIATARFALAQRAVGFGLGRTVLSFSRQRLGLVCNGGQTLPPKSSGLSRSRAAQRQREHARVVSRFHNYSSLHSQTHPSLGFRRDFRDHKTRNNPGLGCPALPFSSDQPLAELPGSTQPQTPRQSAARNPLSTDSPSARASRRFSAPVRAQSAQASRCPSNTVACHAHDCSRISQTSRSF